MTVSAFRGYTYHDLASADMEELTGAVYLRRQPTPGQMFARKQRHVNHGKNRARFLVQTCIQSWARSITVLTLPGMTWQFEHGIRGHRKELQRHSGYRFEVKFVSYECDAAIFRAALKLIPTTKKFDMRLTSAQCVSTPDVRSFECCDVENAILEGKCGEVDAAWLDFTGPLTERRIAAVRELWQRDRIKLLAITTLKARWPRGLGSKIKRLGSVGGFLAGELGDAAKLVSQFEYYDGTPMNQCIFVKPGEGSL